MLGTILLTSFQTWLPHQRSNASDDLLLCLRAAWQGGRNLAFFRGLPVEVEAASQLAIAKINQLNPSVVVCCGMAEKHTLLHLESQAFYGGDRQATTLDLDVLSEGLTITAISHEAGKFVCEGLYFHVLQYLQQSQLASQGLFVHVPILTDKNTSTILRDFITILHRLETQSRKQ